MSIALIATKRVVRDLEAAERFYRSYRIEIRQSKRRR